MLLGLSEAAGRVIKQETWALEYGGAVSALFGVCTVLSLLLRRSVVWLPFFVFASLFLAFLALVFRFYSPAGFAFLEVYGFASGTYPLSSCHGVITSVPDGRDWLPIITLIIAHLGS